MRLFSTALASAVGALALIGLSQPAHAVLTLQLQSGGDAPVLVTDGDNDGVVFFGGAFGGYDIHISSGTSNSNSGAPALLTTNVQAQNTVGGAPPVLTVTVFDDTFTVPVGGSNFTSSANPSAVTNGSIDVDTFVAASQLLNGTLDDVNDTLTTTQFVGVPTPFEVRHVLVFNAEDGSDFNVDVTTRAVVPEPATLAILGFGLAGLGVVTRRRQQR
jgi:hypothetical protein